MSSDNRKRPITRVLALGLLAVLAAVLLASSVLVGARVITNPAEALLGIVLPLAAIAGIVTVLVRWARADRRHQSAAEVRLDHLMGRRRLQPRPGSGRPPARLSIEEIAEIYGVPRELVAGAVNPAYSSPVAADRVSGDVVRGPQ